MRELDKTAMGRRIKQIRLARGYRQWELAGLLGTTQSAVHKYEHGVVPEPRRLIELARIGGTSVEWILTGHHWENGSREQERVDPEVLRTAELLGGIDAEERACLDEALRIVRSAVRAVADGPTPAQQVEPATLQTLKRLGEPTLRLLESAWRIQQSVLVGLLGDTDRRLRAREASHGQGSGDGVESGPRS